MAKDDSENILLEELNELFDEFRLFLGRDCIDDISNDISKMHDIVKSEGDTLGIKSDFCIVMKKTPIFTVLVNKDIPNVLETYKEMQSFKEAFYNVKNKYPTLKHIIAGYEKKEGGIVS